jgi:DNA-binding SARP family transcriptional activator
MEEAMRTLPELPSGYQLEFDADIRILRRLDGSIVASFNARGLTHEAVRQAALADEASKPAKAASVPTASLEARFFGRFELLCRGKAVSLGSNRKATALLKYLLANRPRPVLKDHVKYWLWPESNTRRAMWSLNSTVYALRKLLGECAPTAASSYVLLDDGFLRLCPTLLVSTDVDEFNERYERASRLDRVGRLPEAIEEYEAAADLYRGAYLADDLHESWTMIERERLAGLLFEMLDRLASCYMWTGRYKETIATCYKILDQDRCHEVSYRRLIECYVRQGMRGEALRQYRLCRTILRQEYGIDPSPDTEALLTSFVEERGRIRDTLATGTDEVRDEPPVALPEDGRTWRKAFG